MDNINSNPVVTVIIPTRNEVYFIDTCLNSVFSADPPNGGWEVLVVDGMSDDGTRPKLEKWCEKYPTLRILDNPKRGVPSAMNIGIRAARGKWIIRLDAHSTYPEEYFTRCLETAIRTGADNVGGVFISILRDDCAGAKLVRALTTHRFGVGNARFRLNLREGSADTVPYGCFRREVFERFGLYDERLIRNQDYEFNRRILIKGSRIWLNPEIRVHYYNQNSLRGLYKQALLTGKWNVWMWFVAPYSFAWRHAIPLGFVTAIIAGFLISLSSWSVALLILLSILLPYSTVALVASSQQAMRHGLWMLPLMPFLFFTYHMAYGLGGLQGLALLFIQRSPVQAFTEPRPGGSAADKTANGLHTD